MGCGCKKKKVTVAKPAVKTDSSENETSSKDEK
jgi:hypothetical protein